MDAAYLQRPALFLIEVIFGLYALLVLLRFVLQWARADFHNPISQFVVRATAPVLKPMRRFIPSVAGLDMASLVLAWLVKSAQVLLTVLILGAGLRPLAALLQAIPAVVELGFWIFIGALLIRAVLSWLDQGSYNPVAALCTTITEPLLRPLRRYLPSSTGLDLSPMIAMLILYLAMMLILPPLQALVSFQG